MNNREFYEKWGKSEELKVIVNAIVFGGLQMWSGNDENPRDLVSPPFHLETLLAGNAAKAAARALEKDEDYIKMVECYRDLIRMSDGFIKNVIKKVL